MRFPISWDRGEHCELCDVHLLILGAHTGTVDCLDVWRR